MSKLKNDYSEVLSKRAENFATEMIIRSLENIRSQDVSEKAKRRIQTTVVEEIRVQVVWFIMNEIEYLPDNIINDK